MHPLKKEFIELYRQSGWTQAEAARQLELTRGGVNGLITGPTVPSLATVKLFRLILESRAESGKTPAVENQGNAWAEPLLADLRRLDEGQRSRLILAFREVLRAACAGGSGSGAKGRGG